MARAFGKILSRIWDDPDFLALDPSHQRLYFFLVSQSNLNHAGLLPLTLRKWSKKANGLTIAGLVTDLMVLDATRFIVLDQDTEEVLIRTYLRNDDVYKMPRVMGSAVSGAQEIESPRLRRALLAEVDRLPLEELSDEPTQRRDGSLGPSILAQVQHHISVLRSAFTDVRSDSVLGLPVTLATPVLALPKPVPEPPAEPLPEGVQEGVTEGVSEGDAEGVRCNARGRGPAGARVTPSPTPAPTPAPTTPPPSPPAADGSATEPHRSGREEGEKIDPNHADALTVIGTLPPQLRPSRGSSTQLIDAVAELLRLGWPANNLRARMVQEPPDQIHNLAAFLMQRLPPAIPYRPPMSAHPTTHVLTSGREMCPTHPYIELTSAGTCTSCAGDARARATDDDLDQKPPTAGRQRPAPSDDGIAARAEAAAARTFLRGLEDCEHWLDLARKRLSELGDDSPSTQLVTITAAQLCRAAGTGPPPPDPDPEGV